MRSDVEPSSVRLPGGGHSRDSTTEWASTMVALTILVGSAVLVLLIFAAVRALRRASRQIDDIFAEELDDPDED